jgi:peptidylamidoglycolate lyase
VASLRTLAIIPLLALIGPGPTVGVSGGAGPIATNLAEYEVVHGWPSLPEGRILGQATGVGVDSHNHVFVFHRAGREWTTPFPPDAIQHPTVTVFDGDTGEQVAEWGREVFVMPHGLTVDNEDNVWLTDVGRHQVFKFTHDGELLMSLGTERVLGADSTHFGRPTDIAVLEDGEFYVSDGYLNTRVVKFSATGRFLFQWGTKGSGPGQFDLPHGIAIDGMGRVYVADRSNTRVQVFDPNGEYITEWGDAILGRPYGIAIGPKQKAYIVDGGDQPDSPPDRSRAFRLAIDGTVEAIFGRFGNYDGQFRLGHDIAVGSDGAVYVADAWGMRVQKFLPR